MADGLRIKITNISSVEWERYTFAVGAGSEEGLNWTDELTQTPTKGLAAGHGYTEAAADQEWLTILVRDALYIVLGYRSTDDGSQFAIRVEEQFHAFTFGKGCRWNVWDDGQWIDLGQDSSPYTWSLPRCEIVATPALSNTAAFVDVIINPKHVVDPKHER